MTLTRGNISSSGAGGGEEPVPEALRPPQIRYDLARDRTRGVHVRKISFKCYKPALFTSPRDNYFSQILRQIRTLVRFPVGALT